MITRSPRSASASLSLLSLLVPIVALLPRPSSAQEASNKPTELSILSWNIWHGGREDGKEVGPARVIEVIKSSGADIVAMQETYGSGEHIAKELGFHFQPRGTNVSIHSRYPIVEDISVHKEFECVGALIELPDKSRIAFYSIWLPYSAEIWAKDTRDVNKPATMLAACEASHASLRAMHKAIEARLVDANYRDVPVVIAGDFNSMSHLDYGEIGLAQYQASVSWPTSHILTKAGFADAYRNCHPRIDRSRDSTWTPRFPEQEQDRIDFIFYRAARSHSHRWSATSARVLREHSPQFPSDHAALLCNLRAEPRVTKATSETKLRVASYNIRHGSGMDGKLDLERIAATLADHNLDIIALQEVDLSTKRTNRVN